MSKYWIRYLDPLESIMSKDLYKEVKQDISYKFEWYSEGQYHKIRNEGEKPVILGKSKEGILFYSGLIPRIMKSAGEQQLTIEVDTERIIKADYRKPKLPKGMTLRKFQEEAVPLAVNLGRGILIAPTGTGKTTLGLSLISSIKNIKHALWLCHTKDLLRQTAKDAEAFFPGKVGIIGDNEFTANKFLTIATRQSFIKAIDDLADMYDLVLVDEVHHIKRFFKTKKINGEYPPSEYAEILGKVLADFRYGLTATVEKEDQQAILATEAFIGPVISEYSVEEGIEDGVMAKPIVKITKIPLTHSLEEYRTYKDVYEYGIVRRLERNRIIVNTIKEYVERDLSVLIFVNHIPHGKLIESMAQHVGLDTLLVNGSSDSESRQMAKEYLNSGKVSSVICSTIWAEGVNIPNLNVVINAAGGKSEIRTLQFVGRGLRTTERKTQLIIHDFFDPSHKYLISHFGERISIYCDQGWL